MKSILGLAVVAMIAGSAGAQDSKGVGGETPVGENTLSPNELSVSQGVTAVPASRELSPLALAKVVVENMARFDGRSQQVGGHGFEVRLISGHGHPIKFEEIIPKLKAANKEDLTIQITPVERMRAGSPSRPFSYGRYGTPTHVTSIAQLVEWAKKLGLTRPWIDEEGESTNAGMAQAPEVKDGPGLGQRDYAPDSVNPD